MGVAWREAARYILSTLPGRAPLVTTGMVAQESRNLNPEEGG